MCGSPHARRSGRGFAVAKKRAKRPGQRLLLVSVRRTFCRRCNRRVVLSARAVSDLVHGRMQPRVHRLRYLVRANCAKAEPQVEELFFRTMNDFNSSFVINESPSLRRPGLRCLFARLLGLLNEDLLLIVAFLADAVRCRRVKALLHEFFQRHPLTLMLDPPAPRANTHEFLKIVDAVKNPPRGPAH